MSEEPIELKEGLVVLGRAQEDRVMEKHKPSSNELDRALKILSRYQTSGRTVKREAPMKTRAEAEAFADSMMMDDGRYGNQSIMMEMDVKTLLDFIYGA